MNTVILKVNATTKAQMKNMKVIIEEDYTGVLIKKNQNNRGCISILNFSNTMVTISQKGW